jgi:hypothetical protein
MTLAIDGRSKIPPDSDQYWNYTTCHRSVFRDPTRRGVPTTSRVEWHRRRWIRWTGFTLLGGLLITNFVMAISNSRDDGVIISFDAVQATLSLVRDVLPSNPGAAWAATVLILAALYFMLQQRFLKMELPLKFKKQ